MNSRRSSNGGGRERRGGGRRRKAARLECIGCRKQDKTKGFEEERGGGGGKRGEIAPSHPRSSSSPIKPPFLLIIEVWA